MDKPPPPSTPNRVPARPRESPYGRVTPKTVRQTVPLQTSTWEEPANAAEIRQRISAVGYTGLNGKQWRTLPNIPFHGEVPNVELATIRKRLYPNLRLAKETDMLDPSAHNKYSNPHEIGDRAANIVYLIDHTLSDDNLGGVIIPTNVPNGTTLREVRTRQLGRASEIQRQAFLYFYNGVKAARDHYDSADFDLANTAQRRNLWISLWDISPFKATSDMLGVTASVIDLENIFFNENQDEERYNWQRAFKTIWVYCCERICVRCPGNTTQTATKDRRGWYEDWRTVVNWPPFAKAFTFWEMENVPVKRVAEDSGRRSTGIVATDVGISFEVLH